MHCGAEAPVPVRHTWLKGQLGLLAYGEEATRDAGDKAFALSANCCVGIPSSRKSRASPVWSMLASGDWRGTGCGAAPLQ